MKTLGLIGGMSWQSTLPYYRIINQTVADRLGGLHSARLLLYSVDFHDIEQLQQRGDWVAAGHLLAEAARSLQLAGAQSIVVCTNTMHKVADAIEAAIDIPLLHVADATALALRGDGRRRVGLLGTRFTMEQAFYRQRLEQGHGLQVIVPDAQDRDTVHRIIYDELCVGVVKADSRAALQAVAGQLLDAGAEAIILGCTELSLLLGPEDTVAPLYDTTLIHARHAADWSLA
ncbi:aspartate racemase [Pseudoxanthomonas dokdonensis]|uniref:Aspartate racemase n=1 Tax=Pseudoxanthomonas dokdonensis TaxID=344882 RepID=A0A0R0CJV1_9GAMM|nr:aspartate racemase [Pseudoxanthomonas dokdonensis]